MKLPVCLGHEMSGTIIEVGSLVTTLQLGQNVCVNPSFDDRSYGLEKCLPCKRGKPNLCKRWATYGLNANGGGFSEEIVVKAFNCIALPEGVSLKMGALAEPLAVASHCIRASGFERGQTALVLGAGPIGLAVLLLLKAWGAERVAVTEVVKQRTMHARNFGADLVINPLEGEGASGNEKETVLTAITGFIEEGVDVAFDATGIQSTLDAGLAAIKPGGTFFNIAIHEKPLQLHLNDVTLLEKKILGGLCYTNEDFELVLEAMREGTIPFEQMITSVVPLSRIVEGGFLELIRNKAQHVKILIQPDPAGERAD
jgi:(R,R)-butanediol dehydrogenase / meso-butanediol dehydrogenase / diacetyl reductase